MKDLSLHILDITQNSVRAKATFIEISVYESACNDSMAITIKDNGCGMTSDVIAKVTDPFYTTRTTRHVGMGLPLLKMNALQAGGDLFVESEPGIGTTVRATFSLGHIDRPPLGDIGGTVALIITGYPSAEFRFSYKVEEKEWSVDTMEIREALGDTPINDLKVVRYLKEMISENIEELRKENHIDDKY